MKIVKGLDLLICTARIWFLMMCGVPGGTDIFWIFLGNHTKEFIALRKQGDPDVLAFIKLII